jgi:hypothetical protein
MALARGSGIGAERKRDHSANGFRSPPDNGRSRWGYSTARFAPERTLSTFPRELVFVPEAAVRVRSVETLTSVCASPRILCVRLRALVLPAGACVSAKGEATETGKRDKNRVRERKRPGIAWPPVLFARATLSLPGSPIGYLLNRAVFRSAIFFPRASRSSSEASTCGNSSPSSSSTW